MCVVKEMCRRSVSDDSSQKFIDEYVSKLVVCKLTSRPNASSSALKSQNIAGNRDKIYSDIEYQQLTTKRFAAQNINKYEEINVETVYAIISEKLEILSNAQFMTNHRNRETEIIRLLSRYIAEVDPSLQIQPFGSRHYGLSEPGSNLNLFILTSKSKPL